MIGPKPPRMSPAERRRAEQAAYAAVWVRDGGLCARCLGECGPATRDHRKGRGVGGSTIVENLQLLGGSGTTGCHGWKTANPEAALREGWIVPGHADPADWPARRLLTGANGLPVLAWVLYLPIEDGGHYREITNAEAAERMGLVS